jgi:hypothetical protein
MNLFFRSASVPVMAAAFAISGLLTACTQTQSKPAAHKKTSAKPANDLTQGLGLAAEGSTVTVSDPHHFGWVLYKVFARSGTLDLPHHAFTATGLTALVFAQGQEQQKITAPYGKADTKDETIHAYGGVVVTYVTRPGSDLHADDVVWNAKTQQGVARGHVHFHYLQGKSIITGTIPVAYFNTNGGIITSEPPQGRG